MTNKGQTNNRPPTSIGGKYTFLHRFRDFILQTCFDRNWVGEEGNNQKFNAANYWSKQSVLNLRAKTWSIESTNCRTINFCTENLNRLQVWPVLREIK